MNNPSAVPKVHAEAQTLSMPCPFMITSNQCSYHSSLFCCRCCISSIWKMPSVSGAWRSVEDATESTVDNFLEDYNPACQDLLVDRDSYVWTEAREGGVAALGLTFSAGWVDSLNDGDRKGDGTCTEGCPNPWHSFCKNKVCVSPTCKDVKNYVRTQILYIRVSWSDGSLTAVRGTLTCWHSRANGMSSVLR